LAGSLASRSLPRTCGKRLRTTFAVLGAALLCVGGCDRRPQFTQPQLEHLLFPALLQTARDADAARRCTASGAGAPPWLRDAYEPPRCTEQLRRELAAYGLDASGPDAKEAQNLLTAAALCDNVDVLGRLLSRGVDVNGKDSCGGTALVAAASGGAQHTAEKLLQSRAKLDVAGGEGRWHRTALLSAAARADVPMMRLLIDAGADPNAATPGGRSVLMLAATANSLTVVSLLLERGVDPRCTDEAGLDAGRVARAHGALIVAALIEENARARSGATRCGQTPTRSPENAR